MTKVDPPVWQTSEAQSRLTELVDAAISGAPQVVRRPDGREVGVTAREVSDAANPETVKDWMLSRNLKLEDDDPFFTYLEEARGHLAATFDPSIGGQEFLDAVYPRYKRRKRSNKAPA